MNPAPGSDAPPFALPGSHFAAALAFLVAGSAGLVWVAPDLARGAFLLPRVVAVAHLFTLGWITTSIFGALYQFLPVALGVPVRSIRAAWVTFAFHVPGVALLVSGFLLGRTPLVHAGAGFLTVAVLVFAGNMAATLPRAPRGGLTRRAVGTATVFLVVALALGAALAGNLSTGFLGMNRMLALGVHMHAAALGWVFLVIVGVARRLMPMFLLSHGASEAPGEAAYWLVTAGMATLVLGHHVGRPVFLVAGALTAAGVGAFLLQAGLYARHRRRKVPDAGMALAGAGALSLCVALVLAVPFLLQATPSPRLATAYVTAMILGGFGVFVAGHFYKIVPFLTWYHRYGPRVGKETVPTVAELYSSRWAWTAAVLVATGALGTVASILFGAETLVRVPALLFTGGVGVLVAQMGALLAPAPRLPVPASPVPGRS